MTVKGKSEAQEIQMLREQLALREGLLAVSTQHASARIAELERQLKLATNALSDTRGGESHWRGQDALLWGTECLSAEGTIINAFRACQLEQATLSIEVIERVVSLLSCPDDVRTAPDLIGEIMKIFNHLKVIHQMTMGEGFVMPSPDTMVVEVMKDDKRVGYHTFVDITAAEAWVKIQIGAQGLIYTTYPLYKLHEGEIISRLWTELENLKSAEKGAERRIQAMIKQLAQTPNADRSRIPEISARNIIAEPA